MRDQRNGRQAALRSASGWLLILAIALVWQLAASLLSARHLPLLTDVLSSYFSILTGPALSRDVIPSIARAIGGLGVAVAVGILVGLPLGYFRRLDPWIRPLIEFFRSLPAAALLPVALLLLGSGNRMRVSLIAFGSLFPVLLNAMDGARRVDPDMLDTGRAYGLRSRQLLIRVALPWSLPQIFAGIRTSLAIAVIMMVVSELIATSAGIGALLLQMLRTFRVAETYAVVLVLGTVGWILTTALLRMEAQVLTWHRGWRESAL